MGIVLLTALGVGAATVFGSLLGFVFKKISHRFSDLVLSFAAGIMLCAAITGLIIPSLEYEGPAPLVTTIVGIVCGALFLNVLDKLVPHLHRLAGAEQENHPEGIAAGVGFGGGNNAQALTIAAGIALQNIPEGMVIIGPMLAAGISPGNTFLCAAATGVIEVIGTFLGYFAVSVSAAILPFALAFAGGTMLYVISDEMIPETHHNDARGVTYALLAGFCLMLAMGYLLG